MTQLQQQQKNLRKNEQNTWEEDCMYVNAEWGSFTFVTSVNVNTRLPAVTPLKVMCSVASQVCITHPEAM